MSGEQIHWTGILSIDVGDKENLISSLTEKKPLQEASYLHRPKEQLKGVVENSVVSSNGGSEDEKADIRDVEIDQNEGLELLFGNGSSVLVSEEEEGKSVGGSTDNWEQVEENKEVILNSVSDKDESIKLKDITVSDS